MAGPKVPHSKASTGGRGGIASQAPGWKHWVEPSFNQVSSSSSSQFITIHHSCLFFTPIVEQHPSFNYDYDSMCPESVRCTATFSQNVLHGDTKRASVPFGVSWVLSVV